jgi:mannosyl-3-phosphoglycerate phosphatase
MQALVFTDLDGTLLDHDGYDWKPATSALHELAARSIPVVIVTSKTRPEVEELLREIGLEMPFVVENGAAAFFPDRWADWAGADAVTRDGYRALVLGVDYPVVRHFLESLPAQLGARGFGDWDLEEIARRTGLPRERAALARQREFTEPFLLDDPDRLPEVEQRASEAGLCITRGGRFLHLMGAGQDKGRAVELVIARVTERLGHPVATVGLGDSPNDLPMLQRVDVPIVVPHVEGPRIEPPSAAGWVARAPGSGGWAAEVLIACERAIELCQEKSSV